LGVVIAVLFLISISFTQAQVNIQGKGGNPGKPDKPGEEEVTWAVQIPTEGTMLYGDGTMYTNNDSDIRIKVEKGYSRISKGQKAFHYYFCFKLVNETSRYAGFQSVGFHDVIQYPDEGPCCIFPGDCGTNPATCMGNFLNQNQPHLDYEYFYLKFQVGQHSFTEHLGYIIDGIEDENWSNDDPVKFVDYSDWIKIRVQHQEDFSDPYEYHNVECDERNHDDGHLDNMNIWIVKLNKDNYIFHDETKSCDGVWRIYVGCNPYTEYSQGEDLWMQEQYTQRVEGKGKGKKGGTKTVTVVPLEAKGNFHFYIDFIKNPT